MNPYQPNDITSVSFSISLFHIEFLVRLCWKILPSFAYNWILNVPLPCMKAATFRAISIHKGRLNTIGISVVKIKRSYLYKINHSNLKKNVFLLKRSHDYTDIIFEISSSLQRDCRSVKHLGSKVRKSPPTYFKRTGNTSAFKYMYIYICIYIYLCIKNTALIMICNGLFLVRQDVIERNYKKHI